MTHRSITTLACLQVFMVVAGYFCLGIYMKMNGYPTHNYLVWSDSSIFLRNYGCWLMLLPMIWTWIAIKCKSSTCETDWLIRFSGVMLNAAIFLTFFIATVSHRHPLIISL